MNILVLGGSYFLGKSFVNKVAGKHEVTVCNRGNRPLCIPGVREMVVERHNPQSLGDLAQGYYDAVVDFCGYEKGDIRSVFQALKEHFAQYIFISTSDVYERGLGRELDETAPLEKRKFGGEAGDYIAGKVSLEEELVECSREYGTHYTVYRPVFIYGPDNYAPREGMYFHWIKNAAQILHPVDATGYFQMVYVEDVALAIEKGIGNENAYDCAYNLTGEKRVTYEAFAQALAGAVPVPFERVPVEIRMIEEKGIPLPFPLTEEESNQYNGRKVLQLIGQYTSLEEGLRITANSVFGDIL